MLNVSAVPKWPFGREKRVDFIQRTWCFSDAIRLEVDHHVIDRVMAEHDRLSQLVRLVAQHKIVGAIIGRDLEPAHPPDRVAPERHRRPEHELHAFHHARDEHAGRHLHAHAHGLEPRP